MGSVVKHATATNSVFAFVLGLIAWIYSRRLVVVMAVEYNVVRELRLYPRSLLDPVHRQRRPHHRRPARYTAQAKSQRAKGFEDINVTFDDPVEPGDQ